MYKTICWIVCLLLVSTGVMATPAIRDGSQIGVISMEMGVPVSGGYRNFDAAKHQKIIASTRLVFGSPSTGNDETDVAGAGRFEATGKLRNRSRDILVSPASQDHAATIGGFTIRDTGFGIASCLRADANLAARPVPANIRLMLPQPAAPPVINNTQES
jgi:hypothetical protein